MDKGFETPLGRYRLIALLGQGGMADVYLACTQGPGGFQKLLVVKLARFTGDPMHSTMFLDEARLAAQLSHPNVVQTYEIGEEGSRHYIVMEYLDGVNLSRLRQRASRAGGIPVRLSVQILQQVLEGLEYAHQSRGIDGKILKVVHRDLTPSNIMVTAQGVVKILDFGIAKGADTHSFTQAGRYSGKLNYMPPEQMRGESVDGRADIFSVGVILAESVTGHKFWGNQSGATVAQQLGLGEIPSLADVPGLDPELRRICERALSADRETRYPNAAVFKADINRYLASLGGPVEREELGAFVCETVAEDRAKLQAVIDGQLQRISQLSLAQRPPPPDLPHIEHTPSSRRSIHTETTIKQDELQTNPVRDDDIVIEVTPGRARGATPHPIAPRSRMPVVALVLGAVVVGVLITVVLMRPPATQVAAEAKPAPVQAPVAAAPPSPPPAPTTTRLEVIVSPADATLALDGKPLGTNPYVDSLPRDTKIHELVATAAGYGPVTRRFTLERDLMVQLHLDQVKAEPAKVDAPPPVQPPPPKVAATPRIPVKQKTPAPHAPAHPAPAPEPAAATVPPPPAVTATTPAPPVTDPNKRTIDGDVFDKKPTKRAIDSNVFDDGSKKANIDRDNPWKK